jgi:L-alanine-DL-glutamate epimerase-like enolase superfamily enzyme
VEIAPRVLGQDALQPERISELTRVVTFNVLRDRKISQVARACVDAALWDAIAKTYGVPLWQLWGGYRKVIPIISTAGYYGVDIPIGDQVKRLKDEGLAGCQIKVGGLSPAEDAERVIEAREAVGGDFALVPDANQGWTLDEALDFVDRARGAGIAYFEEPCLWFNDRRLMRDVRTIGRVKTCAGQTETNPGSCRDLIVEGAIDICNFDSSWSGGPTEWRRIADLAQLFDVKMTHHEEPQISAHLLASIPNGLWVDSFDEERDPLWFRLIANRPLIEGGLLHLTDRPGFGWDLDWDFIRRHRVDNMVVD